MPTTEAGRALLADLADIYEADDDIAAIEAEAVAALRAKLAAVVRDDAELNDIILKREEADYAWGRADFRRGRASGLAYALAIIEEAER